MKWVFDRHKKANIKASSVKSCHKVDLPQKGIKLQPPTPKHFISFALYYFNCRFSRSASEMENAWRQLMAFMKWLMSAYTVMWFINAWMCALWFHFLPTYCAFSRIFFDKEKLTWIFYANGIAMESRNSYICRKLFDNHKKAKIQLIEKVSTPWQNKESHVHGRSNFLLWVRLLWIHKDVFVIIFLVNVC